MLAWRLVGWLLQVTSIQPGLLASWRAALQVGACHAEAAWLFADHMVSHRPLQALSQLNAMAPPMRQFWVPGSLVEQLRADVPGAAAALGPNELSALKLVGHLCLLPAAAPELGQELVDADTLPCCMLDRTRWPADPMLHAVSSPAIGPAASCSC
jgi:hypothetical protein